MKLEKYKENLQVIENKVYSYQTLVAEIKDGILFIKEKFRYSRTTVKHINYVANEFRLKTVVTANEFEVN